MQLASSDAVPHAILMMAGISLPTDTVRTETSIRRKYRARLWSTEGVLGEPFERFPRASLSFSSPGAAVLFFLKEEKEKNGGAKFVSFSLSEKEKRETLQPPSHSRIERNYFASTEMTSRPL